MFTVKITRLCWRTEGLGAWACSTALTLVPRTSLAHSWPLARLSLAHRSLARLSVARLPPARSLLTPRSHLARPSLARSVAARSIAPSVAPRSPYIGGCFYIGCPLYRHTCICWHLYVGVLDMILSRSTAPSCLRYMVWCLSRTLWCGLWHGQGLFLLWCG